MMAPGPCRAVRREGNMPKRIATIVCAIVIAAYAQLLFNSFGKPDGWLRDDKGVSQLSDHVSLWAAGRLAREGKPAAAYDWAQHAEVMRAELKAKTDELPFAYPPPFLVVMSGFSGLDYVPSMLLFGLLTLAVYGVVTARILGSWEGAVWMCAPLATMLNFCMGQNGALTAALLGAGLLLLPTRPVLAGVMMGLLTIKPHLGLLLPVALAVTGCWRAFAAAAATALAMALGATLLLGADTWLAFVRSMADLGAAVATTGHDSPFKFQSVYGLLATLGLPRGAAMTVHVLVALGIVALIADAWRRPLPFALKAALLAAATPLMSPYVFVYDLTIHGIVGGFLIRHWLDTECDQRDVLMFACATMLIALFLSTSLPTGVAASLALLALVLRECMPVYREAAAGPGGWKAGLFRLPLRDGRPG